MIQSLRNDKGKDASGELHLFSIQSNLVAFSNGIEKKFERF
jgi:hypothetical protein